MNTALKSCCTEAACRENTTEAGKNGLQQFQRGLQFYSVVSFLRTEASMFWSQMLKCVQFEYARVCILQDIFLHNKLSYKIFKRDRCQLCRWTSDKGHKFSETLVCKVGLTMFKFQGWLWELTRINVQNDFQIVYPLAYHFRVSPQWLSRCVLFRDIWF